MKMTRAAWQAHVQIASEMIKEGRLIDSIRYLRHITRRPLKEVREAVRLLQVTRVNENSSSNSPKFVDGNKNSW